MFGAVRGFDGPLVVTIGNLDRSVSLMASAPWGEWRYLGYAEFEWTAIFYCRESA